MTLLPSKMASCFKMLLWLALIGSGGCATDSHMSRSGDGYHDPDSSEYSSSGLKKAKSLSGELLFQLLAGEFAGNSGQLEEASGYYKKAAELSDDSRIAARSTYISLYGEDYDKALESLDRWSELEPDDADIPRLYAIVYLKLRDPLTAVSHIEKMISLSDDSPKTNALRIKSLLSKEADDVDALIVLQKLVYARQDEPELLILEARYLAQLERYEEAIKVLDRVISLEPEMVSVYIIKSKILVAIGNKGEARELLKTALVTHTEDHALRLAYARMLIEDQRYEESREQFLILQDQDPDNAEVLLSLSLLYIDTKQLDEASKHLEHLLEIGKKVDVANYYLGRIAHNKKEYKIAISHYLRVKHSQYAFEAKLRIAGLFSLLGRHEEAIEQLEVLASQQKEWPRRVRTYLTLGEILRSLHRYEETLEMYNRVLMQKPDDADLLYARAMVAEKVDRLDITESDLLKVLSSEPENVHALNALGYTLADKTERLEEAYRYIKKAASLVPDDPAILDSLGWVSYRLGRMQEALKWMKMAFEKLLDAEIAAHYGEVLWKSNQREKAEEVWQKGLEVNAKHPVLVETIKRLKHGK